MHFSTVFTAVLVATAEASFQPRRDMNLAVPRAALPFGSAGSPYNAFGRRSSSPTFPNNALAKRTEHLKAAQTPGAGGVSAPADGAKVQVVQVGGSNGSLTFSPNDIKAEMGSFVQFQFNPKNHSVVQSTFDAPCMPMSISMPNASANAFFSGFMPAAAAGNGSKLTYTIQITDTKPLWFYCSQGKHCQAGMVGAINAYVFLSTPLSSVTLTSASQCLHRPEDPRRLHPARRRRRREPVARPDPVRHVGQRHRRRRLGQRFGQLLRHRHLGRGLRGRQRHRLLCARAADDQRRRASAG